ncbi:MAG: MATE family efflux transporter [Clostridia bacterium]|nr:MATE family efflux transporter [Clostridia bacterium]
MKVRNMTEGSPIRLILSVALPLMLGNVFQQLYTVVDAQIVGSVEGVSALAALGASDWFNWLYLGIIQGLAQGFTIPMAQAFGAKDYAGLRRCVGNSIILAVLNALVITAIALLSINPVLGIMDTPLEIRPLSTRYLTVLFAGFPVVMAYNLMAGILRALGDGRSPLYAMAVACAVNIGLDLLFVAAFGWGVEGAAIATVIAQLCSCLFCLLRLKKLDFIRPSREDLKMDGAVSARLMKLGLPVAAQNGTIGIGGMILQSIVNGMGVTFIAGYTATNKLYGVLEIAAISYGYAMSTFTGQNLGARKIRRIHRGTHAAAITGVITACVIAGFMFIFGRAITGSFISGTPEEMAEAGRIAWEYLQLMSICLPILYILHIYRSSLQGMGRTFMPMMSGIAEFVMRTGSAFLLPGLIGYSGLFWAEILAWIGADLILVTSYYASYAHLRRSIPEAM